jgi:hypothetical protein
VPTDTSCWFVAGATAIGPVVPTLIQSLDQYVAVYGARTGGAPLYDAADVFFREGGSKLWVSAIPTTPSGLSVQQAEPQAAPAVPLDRAELEQMTRDELNAKAAEVGIADPGSLPNKEAVIDALVGPPADVEVAPAAVTSAQIETALDLFTDAYGPGQVSVPGSVDPAVNHYLLQHAMDHNRVALLESPPAADAATLIAFAANYTSDAGAIRAALFGPLGIFPGVASGTTRSIGWTAVVAGCIARNEGRGLNPNIPAAGVDGISTFALDVEKRFIDTDYTNLNANSVDMAQYRWGALETFGWRTLADPVAQQPWWSLGFARLRMAIEAQAGAVAERYVFSEIDGRGLTIAQFGSDLRAILVPFYESGALYGDTADDAFQVNVGPAVNTPATIANGELHAVLEVRMSPFAEYVVIEIVKVATTQAIAA